MSDDRFPELTACNKAKQAVKDFDKKHAAKLNALIKIGEMLISGGWAAVRFEEETPFVPPTQRIPEDTINMVSKKALEGDTLETIVRERKYLMQQWIAAYDAVPGVIRASAPNPHGSATRLRETPMRRR